MGSGDWELERILTRFMNHLKKASHSMGSDTLSTCPGRCFSQNFPVIMESVCVVLKLRYKDYRWILRFSEYTNIIDKQLWRGGGGCRKASRIHYLPHQAVVCKDSATTQGRVVYDVFSKDGKIVACFSDCCTLDLLWPFCFLIQRK